VAAAPDGPWELWRSETAFRTPFGYALITGPVTLEEARDEIRKGAPS
jgi:hypothetical protein